MLSKFFGVASATVPAFIIIFAVGNFLGPLLLGRLFDTVGRKPMIAGTYLASAGLTVLLGFLLLSGGLTQWSFIAVVGITFFFASAGASAAYLTVSEIFLMETRALAIALFYAVGTGAGGIIGPLLFGNLIDGGQSVVAIGFFIGAAVMAVGGVVELLFGVHAERTPLENIAKPLAAVDDQEAVAPAPAEPPDVSPEQLAALRNREHAEEERARAAEHRAAAHELAAEAIRGGTNGHGAREDVEELLAQIAELRAKGFDELAVSHEERAGADHADGDRRREAARERAAAAEERAQAHQERAEALAAEQEADAQVHPALADAASERARAREQRALADEARGQAPEAQGADAAFSEAVAARHDAWEQMHTERALARDSWAHGDEEGAARHDREAEAHQEHALAADDRVAAARRRVEVAALRRDEGAVEQSERELERTLERERHARERDERIRRRLARQELREQAGVRRFLPGPGRTLYSPGMVGTASRWAPTAEQDLDREIAEIERALDERGPTDRDALAALVGARYWGPGRFRAALVEAVHEGRARRLSRNTYAPGGAA